MQILFRSYIMCVKIEKYLDIVNFVINKHDAFNGRKQVFVKLF